MEELLVWVIGFVIVVAIIVKILELAVTYWYVIAALVAAAMALNVWLGKKKEEQRRVLAERYRLEQEMRARFEYQREQREIADKLTGTVTVAKQLIENVLNHTAEADAQLDRADVEFRDRAFAPFWDCVERSILSLGRLDNDARAIGVQLNTFADLKPTLSEGSAPIFPISQEGLAKLRAGTTAASRMKGIVRSAQRDFQFATIYEQRRTNQILIAGFNNLAEAIDHIGDRIEASLQSLGSKIDSMASTMDDQIGQLHADAGAIIDASAERHSEYLENDRAHGEKEDKTIEILDNIQRRRLPG